MQRGAEVITVRQQAEEDNMGNPTLPAAGVPLHGCAVYARGASTEDAGRQVTTIQGATILIPPQAGVELVRRSSEIEWTSQRPGEWIRVEGEPFPWKDIQGRLLGVQVNVEGAWA